MYKLLISSVVPRPIAWVSSVDAAGVRNLAPFSYFMAITDDPPTIAFSSSFHGAGTDGKKDTLRNVEATREFVVNVVDDALAAQMNLTSGEYPPEVDEFELAGLAVAPATRVQPPRVAEAPIAMECRLDRIVPVGRANLVLGRIVDVHTHYDAQLTWDSFATPSTALGVTTVVIGNCGFTIAPCRPGDRDLTLRALTHVEGMSLEALRAGVRWDFETYPQYLDAMERRGVVPNVGSFVGHSSVRTFVLGPDATKRAATDAEIGEMRRIVLEAMRAGAIGFATSTLEQHNGENGIPMPSRLADERELLALTGALGEAGRGVFMLTKGSTTTVPWLEEVSAKSRRPVMIAAMFVDPGDPTRVFREVAEIESGRDPFDVFLDFGLDGELDAMFDCRLFNTDEDEVRRLLRHPHAAVGLSDAGAHLSFLCDAGFGLHLFGHWVRERGDLTLPEAVRRVTSDVAAAYRIADRGRLVPGAWADLLLFDPATVARGEKRRVQDLPTGAERLDTPGVGVHGVWVNGVRTVDERGIIADCGRPGRVLRDFPA